TVLPRTAGADELCRIPRRRLAHRQRRHRRRLQRTHQVPVLPQRDALETRVWGADFATSRNQALTTMGQLLGECYAASYVVVHQGEITPVMSKSNFTFRRLDRMDEPFLREMLYHALYVPDGQPPFAKEIINEPELAKYVDH